MPRPFPSALRGFLRGEAVGGVLLILAAMLALFVANGTYAPNYFLALEKPLGPLSIHRWINDGLMALFFLLVGLEIKCELVDGHLRRWSDRRLPFIAAFGGMAVPAAIYLAVAGHDPLLRAGWAIPSATDIAFAVGVLALLGSRVPASLKLFLTTVAIVDDMGAIAIIALFYSAGLDAAAIAAAGFLFGAMLILNRLGVVQLAPYLVLAVLLWVAVLLSGVHATIAGVLTAAAIPLRASPARPDDARSPLHRLEHALSPWVAYLVVPLFGFANAGVPLIGVSPGALLAPVPLAIVAGLFLGKQAGVFASMRIAVALGLGTRPTGASWQQVYGVALLCGIGFTMSLFIGGLAFAAAPLLLDEVKMGVLAGSILSAIAGYALLRLAPRMK